MDKEIAAWKALPKEMANELLKDPVALEGRLRETIKRLRPLNHENLANLEKRFKDSKNKTETENLVKNIQDTYNELHEAEINYRLITRTSGTIGRYWKDDANQIKRQFKEIQQAAIEKEEEEFDEDFDDDEDE